MTTELVIGDIGSNTSQSGYDHLESFACQNKRISLSDDTFGYVLSFLGPHDLGCSEKVCRYWNGFIKSNKIWEQNCMILLGVSNYEDLEKYRPSSPSSKESVKRLVSQIIDPHVYSLYIGDVGPAPAIPNEISLTKWNEADPCDPTKKVGSGYFWMYRPSYIEISVSNKSPLYLDGPDDLSKPDAPKLMERAPEYTEGLLIRLAKKALPEIKIKVPMTINNFGQLFGHSKIGNRPKYNYITDALLEQHGNKRIKEGWACIKKEVIGRNLSYPEQLALADQTGVVLSDLATRILANLWNHARSGDAKTYLDRHDPSTFARTSTPFVAEGNEFPSGCGDGGDSGLGVYTHFFDNETVGLGVELPSEISVIGPSQAPGISS